MLSQADRPIRVDTPLGEDVLLLTGMTGHEVVSRPFQYHLDLMSTQRITGSDMLRQPISVTVRLQGGRERVIYGVVSRFSATGQRDSMYFYQADLSPGIWFLSLGRNNRIFQNKTVPEIVQEIFSDAGWSDYDLRLKRTYSAREYCVQYRESELDFISRLLEEEGIYYFFEHGDGKHTMVVSDDNSGMTDSEYTVGWNPQDTSAWDQDAIRSLRREDAVFVGKVTLSDYDYLQPSLNLRTSISGQGVGEIYEWRGRYTDPQDGDRYARIRLEAEEALQHLVRGAGYCRELVAGHRFMLEEGSDRPATELALLEVTFEFRAGDYGAWDSGPFECACEFVAIPFDQPYRPLQQTPRPVMRGSQTAVVVGPDGEEIWVDKHGRVKVQFHWDRLGEKNEASSCWVRVASSWAGKGWGMIQIPRIGQEVIVDFLEGDPDLPIITGRVYNAEQVPPWELPDNQTQSGIRSRSSPGGSTETFNEIRMEDKKDKEQLYIHAQKDHVIVVENDRSLSVGNDETTTIENDRTEEVKNDETITIGNNRTEDVAADESITIGGNRKEEVSGNETIEIGGNRQVDVGGDEALEVSGKRSRKVDGAEEIKVGGKRSIDVTGDMELKVKGSRTTKVDSSDSLKVGSSLTIKAGTSITLKVGGNSIKIDASGITIKGTMVKVKGTAQAEVKAPMTKVQGDGMLTVKGAMNQVKGDGLLMLKGGVTMIN